MWFLKLIMSKGCFFFWGVNKNIYFELINLNLKFSFGKIIFILKVSNCFNEFENLFVYDVIW